MADEIARVTVDALVRASIAAGVELEVLAGAAGLDRDGQAAPIRRRRGWRWPASTRALQAGRVLVFGESEVRFLDLAPRRRRRAAATIAKVFSRGNACVVVTKQLEPPDGAVAAEADAAACRCCAPRCRRRSPSRKLGALLDDLLAPRDDRATACSSTCSASAC